MCAPHRDQLVSPYPLWLAFAEIACCFGNERNGSWIVTKREREKREREGETGFAESLQADTRMKHTKRISGEYHGDPELLSEDRV